MCIPIKQSTMKKQHEYMYYIILLCYTNNVVFYFHSIVWCWANNKMKCSSWLISSNLSLNKMLILYFLHWFYISLVYGLYHIIYEKGYHAIDIWKYDYENNYMKIVDVLSGLILLFKFSILIIKILTLLFCTDNWQNTCLLVCFYFIWLDCSTCT